MRMSEKMLARKMKAFEYEASENVELVGIYRK